MSKLNKQVKQLSLLEKKVAKEVGVSPAVKANIAARAGAMATLPKQTKEKKNSQKVKIPPTADRFMVKSGKMLSKYFASLINPWADINAKFPEPGAYPSVPFKSKFELNLTSDANQRACVIIRDGFAHCYAMNAGTVSNMAYSTGAGGDKDGWYINSNWAGQPEQSAMISAFSAYRVVSMGVKYDYQAAPLNAAGRCTAALYPPSIPLPNNPDPVGEGGNAVTWREIQEFEGATTFAAIEGCTMIWKPFTTTGLARYRPTKHALDGMSVLNDPANPLSWDLDPETLVFPEILALLVRREFKQGAAGTSYPEATAQDDIKGFLQKQLPYQSPALILAFEGVPPSTLFGKLEVVVNYEAIADNRTFSLAQATQERTGGSAEVAAAVGSLPSVTAHSNTQTHQDWATGVAKTASVIGAVGNVASNIGQALGSTTAGSTASLIGDVIDVGASILAAFA